MTNFLPSDFEIHSGHRKSGAYLLAATAATITAAPRFQPVPSKGLDALGITQRKLNGNFNSWMDELSDRDKEEGGLWYPTGNDWGHHMAALHDRHPDKVFGVMSKMSPQRDWYGNLDDAHMMAQHFDRNPGSIYKPAGISGSDNLKQSMRVMGAHDDPESINAAFLGTKNAGGGRMVPRTPKDLPKTHDFYTALRDPEAGGAGNYAHQPAVADSWMSRSMLWSKKRWDDAQNGGKPLTWPGQGTGEGLDKHLPVKKPNPETGKWEVTGSKPPTARDVAARITGMGGGYDRMRQAMQQGAARHDMPFAHGAQAAVWKSISGNANPDPNPQYGDLSEIQHDPRGLWNEQWARRASGLHVPQQQGLTASWHLAAIGSLEDAADNTDDSGWGGPEDISAILRHISMAPAGWDHWEGRPGLISLDHRQPSDSPLERHERQRMGPHPGPIEASAWYTGTSGRGPWNNRPNPLQRPRDKPAYESINPSWVDAKRGDSPDAELPEEADAFDPRSFSAAWQDGVHTSEDPERSLKVRQPWGEADPETGAHSGNPHYEWQHQYDPEQRAHSGTAPSLEEAKGAAERSHADVNSWDPEADPFDPREFAASYWGRLGFNQQASRWYLAADDGLDSTGVDQDKKKKNPSTVSASPGSAPSASGGASGVLPGMNDGLPQGGSAGLPKWNLPNNAELMGGGGMATPSMPGSGGSSGAAPAAYQHPDGGPASANLTQALQRAGIDPSMYSTISGFSTTEGNNPSGAPTLGFTDSQAGGSLDQHAQALSKQIKDRASVTGEFPTSGTPEQKASWMATLVGQNGSSSDWQGNAQPARSTYVDNIVKNMPTAAPAV